MPTHPQPELAPLADLLTNSIYVPSTEFDGSVVKAYADEYRNFVYCDIGPDDLTVPALQQFRGYEVMIHRRVDRDELVPADWRPSLPDQLRGYCSPYSNWLDSPEPFAYAAVYQRQADYSDMHGPMHFNLLFVYGDGAITYQALYESNCLAPKVVILIQPEVTFGPNWVHFLDERKALGHVVMQNPHGKPEFVSCTERGMLRWRSYLNVEKERYCRYARQGIRVFHEYRPGIITPEEIEKSQRRSMQAHAQIQRINDQRLAETIANERKQTRKKNRYQ